MTDPTITEVVVEYDGAVYRIIRGDTEWLITHHGELIGGAPTMEAAITELGVITVDTMNDAADEATAEQRFDEGDPLP